MKTNTQRVDHMDVLAFVDKLMEKGHNQITLLFHWQTGEWEVSWPQEYKRPIGEQHESGD